MSETAAARPLKRDHVFDRDPHNWYVEPACVSDALFGVERFVGDIWDPACGGGHICVAAGLAGYHAHGSDIVRREHVSQDDWAFEEMDFLAAKSIAPRAPNIVCNPPYFGGKGSEAFIRKALSLVTGKVAMFVDIRFLAGATRANGLFAEHPPTRIWMVTPRVSCPPGEFLENGGKAEGGTPDYVWLVWDLTAPRVNMPPFGWIRSEAP